jgi:hypothetical protein
MSAAIEAVEAAFRADGEIGPRANLDSFENWDKIALPEKLKMTLGRK